VTAVVAGVVAGVFGGSNVQVSGPTGAMTVVLVPIVARYGPGAVPVLGLMAGVLIILTTHNEKVREALGKRILTMEKGKLVDDVKHHKHS
jgi:hypothetical protein